jgi:hypothetical protein
LAAVADQPQQSGRPANAEIEKTLDLRSTALSILRHYATTIGKKLSREGPLISLH